MTAPALVLILSLACARNPELDPARLPPLAAAIDAATDDPAGRALLVALALHENGLNAGGVPFGVTDHGTHRGESLVGYATVALAVWGHSAAYCWRTPSPEARLGWFHTGVASGGRCWPDAYARRVGATYRRLLALAGAP